MKLKTKIIIKKFFLIILFVVVLSCGSDEKLYNSNNNYAKLFEVGNNKITIYNPWQGAKDISKKYVFTKNNAKNKIQIPVRRVICLSSTHLSFLQEIDELRSVVGIASIKQVYNKEIRRLFKDGKIEEVGDDLRLDYAKILKLKPDVVFVFGVDKSSLSQINKLELLGVNVVFVSEYLEKTALARAEWIKFFAKFYEKEKLAEAKFNKIAKQYNFYKKKVKTVKKKPSVLLNLPYQGVWYLPGNDSYQAKLIADAGGNYIFSNIKGNKSTYSNLQKIYKEARSANIWINLGKYKNKKEILSIDKRLAYFEAMKTNKMFNNDKQAIGLINNYWEEGTTNPQEILKDLISIFHPNLLDEDEFYFYRKI